MVGEQRFEISGFLCVLSADGFAWDREIFSEGDFAFQHVLACAFRHWHQFQCHRLKYLGMLAIFKREQTCGSVTGGEVKDGTGPYLILGTHPPQ